MKCKYCGGNLTLEALKCPFCGRENEQALKHARAMKRYHTAFEKTRKGVEDSAHRFNRVSVRITAAAVLVVAVICLLLLGGKSYELKRAVMRHQANIHSEEYMKLMDTMLREEDFLAFSAFCNEKYIDTYDTVYEKYVPTERVSGSFAYVYADIMNIVCPPEYLKPEQACEMLAESLNYFYGALNIENYEYCEDADSQQNKEALAAMEERVRLMLITYVGISEEDADTFGELSKARRGVLLEDAVMSVMETAEE